MTGLLHALKTLAFNPRPWPAQGAVARFAAALPPAAPVVRPKIDLDTVAARFLHDVTTGTPPSGADWNKIAWCLWTTTPALAGDDRALGAVLERVESAIRLGRRRPYRQLAAVYFSEFAAARPGLARIAAILRSHAAVAGPPFAALAVTHGVFAGGQAPGALARSALAAGTSVPELLAAAGAGGALLTSEFVRAAHDEGLRMIAVAPPLPGAGHVETVREWSLRSDRRLLFETSRSEVARAVIVPFGDRIPAGAERRKVLDFIISRFGDPRINRNRWIGMEDVAQVLHHWLTEQSLRQFLDVVDRIAPDHMWKYRRAFWQAWHQAGLLQNAWVVFGDHGAVAALQAFGPSVQFGKFKSGGRKQVQSGHAVLLLDLGACVVADWSHNGRCNIWKKSDRSRPLNLNAPAYTSSEIMRPLPRDDSESNLNKRDIFSHHGSEHYVWQNRVAARLEELIGTRVPQTDYQIG